MHLISKSDIIKIEIGENFKTCCQRWALSTIAGVFKTQTTTTDFEADTPPRPDNPGHLRRKLLRLPSCSYQVCRSPIIIMSDNYDEQELDNSFIQEARRKLIHYHEANPNSGLLTRMLNLVDEGLIEYSDVNNIVKDRPTACTNNSANFGLGLLDDNRDLLVRNITSNPDIIEGVLKSDTTGMFIGASKSYKTWHLIRLALCVSHGLPWFGNATRRSKVLIINPELIDKEFQLRVQKVARELGITHLDHAHFNSICLHKKYLAPDDLMDAIENMVTRDQYDLVVLDSLYRLYGPRTDENSNADMLKLLTRMEKMISNPNSAIIFSHHSPKGDQSGKRSIDVAAGGGALGRFVATCITTRIIEEKTKRFSLEFTSRYHRYKESIGLIMDGPIASVDAAFNSSELNANNRYNNSDLLELMMKKRYTASELQEEVKSKFGMSRAAFYKSYWPEVKDMEGVSCVDGKYRYDPDTAETDAPNESCGNPAHN